MSTNKSIASGLNPFAEISNSPLKSPLKTNDASSLLLDFLVIIFLIFYPSDWWVVVVIAGLEPTRIYMGFNI